MKNHYKKMEWIVVHSHVICSYEDLLLLLLIINAILAILLFCVCNLEIINFLFTKKSLFWFIVVYLFDEKEMYIQKIIPTRILQKLFSFPCPHNATNPISNKSSMD